MCAGGHDLSRYHLLIDEVLCGEDEGTENPNEISQVR